MRGEVSHPLKVFLSGVLDGIVWFVLCIILFWIFDDERYKTPFKGSFHSLATSLSTLFTVSYLFFILPFLEYRKGSAGKRIFGLKNLRKDQSIAAVPFSRFFKKGLFMGLPVLLLFFINVIEIYTKKNVWPFHLAIDILVIGIFSVQIFSLFVTKLSLLEWVSGTLIVDKKRTVEKLSFSFDDEGNELPKENF